MANHKTGFNFISIQVNRYGDGDIKRLRRHHGGTGVAVFDYICSLIYRDTGCYLVWDENTAFDVAEYWNIKETLLEEIINYCCHVGLFDKELRTNESILSSRQILTNFLYWSELAKRKNVKIPEFLIKLQEEPPKLPEDTGQNSGTLPVHNLTKPNLTKPNQTRKGAPDKPAADPVLLKNLVLEKFSEAFIPTWKKWLDYKKAQFKFQYKHEDSHRAGISELFNLSDGNEITAGAIIQQSMAQGWKGLFQEKKSAEVKTDQPPGSQAAAAPVIFDTVSAKMAAEINYLYERYLEGEVTVKSAEVTHYNYLKSLGMVNFNDEIRGKIQKKAHNHIVEKAIAWTQSTELDFMKRFGVLEYFSQIKTEGRTIVFDHDHRK